jgi:tetratricopeptide (TPR) repeat protein
MPMRRLLTLLLTIAAVTGCATKAKPVSPPVASVAAPPAVDVAALMRHGCFRCLEQAMAAATGEQAFEVAALLTWRAKELGLPYDAYLEKARALAPDDPAFAVYLQILEGAPVEPLSGERYSGRDGAFASATRTGSPGAPGRLAPVNERARGWRDGLATAPGSPMLRGYAMLLANCTARVFGDTGVPAADAVMVDGEAPLLRYRAGLCGDGTDLRRLREEDPDFVDADFLLGRLALGGRAPELDEALRRIQAVAAAFPESPAVMTVLGIVYEQREEWAEAFAAFDSVVTRAPEHRDALLGRTMALSHLGRNVEAVASATRMIELGSWFLGEAHYWRAWNEFQLQQYPLARTDADRAKSLMVNASVFVLSGLIEWNERRLPTAESELVEALKMDFGRCDAARYLGRIRTQRAELPEAIAAFKQAIQCFNLAITVRQRYIADVEAGTSTPATKARLIAGHQRAIAASIKDRDECTQNLAALEKTGGRS